MTRISRRSSTIPRGIELRPRSPVRPRSLPASARRSPRCGWSYGRARADRMDTEVAARSLRRAQMAPVTRCRSREDQARYRGRSSSSLDARTRVSLDSAEAERPPAGPDGIRAFVCERARTVSEHHSECALISGGHPKGRRGGGPGWRLTISERLRVSGASGPWALRQIRGPAG
jgi:hypothetical protein